MNSWLQQTFSSIFDGSSELCVSNAVHFFQVYSPSPTSHLPACSPSPSFHFQTNQAWECAPRNIQNNVLFVCFFAVFLARPFFWLPPCDSVFFLNRLTSLKVQSFVWNHQSVHTKSAWLHASEKIKGSEVGTVIQRERVVCSQAYHFIPSCIFTSKPLSMQISLVWTVDPPITSYFCFSSFLPP